MDYNDAVIFFLRTSDNRWCGIAHKVGYSYSYTLFHTDNREISKPEVNSSVPADEHFLNNPKWHRGKSAYNPIATCYAGSKSMTVQVRRNGNLINYDVYIDKKLFATYTFELEHSTYSGLHLGYVGGSYSSDFTPVGRFVEK